MVSPDENMIVVEPYSDVIGCYKTRFAGPYPGLHYKPCLGAILSYPFIAPFGKATLFLWKVGTKHFAVKKLIWTRVGEWPMMSSMHEAKEAFA